MDTAAHKPDFLVIGAMKCGTTTLYHDLSSHPDILLPDKESNLLFTADPADAYDQAFQKARPGQVCGEVCPDYSKRPDLIDAIPNALNLLNDSAPRIIYLIRNPLHRTLSHHRFVSSRRDNRFPSMAPDINQCIHQHPELLDYSRYSMQLQPWIDAFGKESLLVIRFEDYIQNRADTLNEIFTFLEVQGDQHAISTDRIYNQSDSRPVLTPGWQRFIETKFYRQMIRPLLFASLREKIRSWVLPLPNSDWIPVTAETAQYIVDQVRDDMANLQQMLDLESPLWDLDKVLAEYKIE